MSVNKVILVGRLGKDPESRTAKSGTQITKFSLATDRRNHDDGPDWHNIVTFGRTAEICQQFLSKGRQVYVEGRIQYDKYEKDGQPRHFTEIVAFNVQFLSGGDRQQKRGPAGPGRPAPSNDYPSTADSDIPF